MNKQRAIMPVVKCVTMQRDESVLLQAWLRYHGYLFGFHNLTVIDNGSVLPGVLETLDQAAQAGVQIYRQFSTPSDYLRKGEITTSVIRAIDHRNDYDFMLPLDCDEFFAVWTEDGLSVDSSVIAASLNELDRASTHFRINNCLYNDPGRPGWFWAQGALKGFLRSKSVEMLDHGNHTFSARSNFEMAHCEFTHLHFHHKPFDVLLQQTLWKLAPFTDITDLNNLADFKGPGAHLLRNLFNTPEEYLRQFDDHLTFYFDGFSRIAAILGLDRSFFKAQKLEPPSPPGSVRVRRPRDIEAGQTLGSGDEMDFAPTAYLLANLDVSASGTNPVRHFLSGGFFEGRSVRP